MAKTRSKVSADMRQATGVGQVAPMVVEVEPPHAPPVSPDGWATGTPDPPEVPVEVIAAQTPIPQETDVQAWVREARECQGVYQTGNTVSVSALQSLINRAVGLLG